MYGAKKHMMGMSHKSDYPMTKKKGRKSKRPRTKQDMMRQLMGR